MCDQHEFLFEFDKAYNHQLIEKFEASPEHQLTPDVAPREKGVYALYHKGELVYAGKPLKTKLRQRLAEHHRKISGRGNISVEDMTCRFLIVQGNWFVRAAEDALIESYLPSWQMSGFGSKIPGVGRPGIKVSRWDTDFPTAEELTSDDEGGVV